MEVKGSAIITIPRFVQARFATGFDAWLESLSPEARKIMKMPMTSSWYPLNAGIVEPTQKLCDQFYGGDEKGAWEAGRFSAEEALKGMYRLFIQLGTPAFLIGKSSQVFSTYFRPSRVEVVDVSSKRGVLQILEFPESHRLVECRIAAWMKRGLELSGCTAVNVTIGRSLARGDALTEIVAEWK